MQRRSLICVFLLTTYCLLNTFAAKSQDTTNVPKRDTIPAADTTHPTSIDPALIDLSNPKNPPHEYVIAGIKITGTKYLDETLLTSISGLTVGDKMTIPGGDNFSKAIGNLWKQRLFADIAIYFTRVVGNNIYIEINVTERPRLGNFYFRGPGVKKGDGDDLTTKTGLIKGRVITEDMKRSAIQAIKRFYADKGYQTVAVTTSEVRDPTVANSEILTFMIDKGPKVRVYQISFFGNDAVRENKLKKQLKDTKELSRMTLYPPSNQTPYGPHDSITLRQYLRNWGFLSFTGTKEFLDPWFRFKMFSSAKFNATKFETDKQKVIDYYNSQGYRDANIVKDTTFEGDAGPETVPLNQFTQADATLRGVEGRVDAEVVSHFVLGAIGDMVRGELKDSKEPLPYMPAARLGALARWDNGRYSIGGEVRHGFKQDRVPPTVSEDDPSGVATDAFTLVNLSAGLNLPFGDQVHAFTLRVDNVGNTKYRDATSRIKTFAYNPGRNVSLVYRVLF